MTTSTQHSNLAIEEIFSDNYSTEVRLLSQTIKDKLQSQRTLKQQKDTNEKTET